jgi:sialic acid synthase
VELAKVIIDLASRDVKDEVFGGTLKGMDAVKLTKRDLTQELSASQMNRIYDNPNSFGRTYGEHRSALELSNQEHFEVYQHAKEKGLDFVETLCAIGCLSMLKLFIPDKLKVASRDLTNLPLLSALAETRIPIIVSTGMGGRKELDDAIKVISKYHSDISILHCVSQYPTRPKNVNLNTIAYLLNNYRQYVIGYSDHTIGISTPIAAIAMGAKIIEKHITLDRLMKGTDQKGSLGPDGIYRMVRNIRILDESIGTEDIFIVKDTSTAKEKLERSIASNRKINIGEVINECDIHMLSPGDGFKWAEKNLVIGKEAKTNIAANEIIYKKDVI